MSYGEGKEWSITHTSSGYGACGMNYFRTKAQACKAALRMLALTDWNEDHHTVCVAIRANRQNDALKAIWKEEGGH